MAEAPPRPKLALAIPTYVRPEAVAANLEAIAPEARRLGVTVYLSDDSPDERTAQIARLYPDLVTYRRNLPGLGHDRNVLQTLLWPDAEYVWLLGDVLAPRPDALESVLGFLDGQDLVFMNQNATDISVRPRATGEEARSLLIDKLWHQTLTGATIYHRQVLDWARAEGFPLSPNFPQLSVILSYASAAQPVIAWHGPKVLMVRHKPQSYWQERAIDVFVGDWARLVESHADLIGPDRVKQVIRAHSLHSNLFDSRRIAALCLNGQLTSRTLRQPHFWDAMHLPRVIVLAIVAAPRPASALLHWRDTWRRRIGRAYRKLAQASQQSGST